MGSHAANEGALVGFDWFCSSWNFPCCFIRYFPSFQFWQGKHNPLPFWWWFAGSLSKPLQHISSLLWACKAPFTHRPIAIAVGSPSLANWSVDWSSAESSPEHRIQISGFVHECWVNQIYPLHLPSKQLGRQCELIFFSSTSVFFTIKQLEVLKFLHFSPNGVWMILAL